MTAGMPIRSPMVSAGDRHRMVTRSGYYKKSVASLFGIAQ
jgi:hypothetical protein